MTIIFSDGFESGDLLNWTTSSGTWTVDGTYKHSGVYGARVPHGSFNYLLKALPDSNLYYARAYVMFNENPTTQDDGHPDNQLFFYNYLGDLFASLGLYQTSVGSPDFAWFMAANDGGWTGASGFSALQMNPTLDVWHFVELFLFQHITNGEVRGWVDGVELTDVHFTNLNMPNNPIGGFQLCDGYYTQAYDDAVISDQYNGPTSSLPTMTFMR